MRYRSPLTLRLLFHGVRAAVSGLLLLVAAWIALVPATAEERAALGARIGDDRPDGLVAMRVARAMVHFAPDRAAKMLARASNGELSEEFAGMLLRDLASGPVAQREAFDDMVAAPAAQDQPRQVGDAKFLTVD